MYYDKPSQENKWKIDLPGGGFIQKPGSQSAPVLNDDFDSPEVNKGTLDLQLQLLVSETRLLNRPLRKIP